jgi:spore maturation protein A
MMKWVFSGFVALAVLFGAATGRMNEVSTAALTSCGDAVQLVITLTGSMCLWSGLMKVADTAGLTEKLSLALRPVLRLLFKGMEHTSESARVITMNMAANLLGLGNAATPLGIAAMRAMAKEERAGSAATDNMVMFVVLNTASLQLIPTTPAVMRAAAGSLRPLDITPAVWLASAFSVAVGVSAVKLMGKRRKRL